MLECHPDSIACGSTCQVERKLNMMCCTGHLQAVLNRANAQKAKRGHMDELFLLDTPGVIGPKVPCGLGMLLLIVQQKHVPLAGIEILLVLNGLGIVCWLGNGKTGLCRLWSSLLPAIRKMLSFLLELVRRTLASWCFFHFISFHFISETDTMQLSVHLKSQSPIRERILRVIKSFICLRKLRQTSSLRPGFGCRLLEGQILKCSGGNLSLGTSSIHPRTCAKTHADLVFPDTGRNPIVECHLVCAEMQNAPKVCDFEAKKLNKRFESCWLLTHSLTRQLDELTAVGSKLEATELARMHAGEVYTRKL